MRDGHEEHRDTVTEPSSRRWFALAVLVLPVLLISMDGTVLGFAIPELSASLDPTSSQLLWIIDIYAFVLAGLLVTMGVLGDRIGRRRLLMIGAAGFCLASILAAFSTSAEMLIGARALLGVAGATLMPSTLSLIRNIFHDDNERQFAIAVWATTFAVGSAAGPVVGGFLLAHYWWGSIFLVAAPITLALLILAPVVLPESKDPSPGRFDLISAALSMLTMLSIIYAIKATAEHGLSGIVAIAATIGGASAVAFVHRQNARPDPMIDMSLFSVPRFRSAVSGNLVACMGFAGSTYFITQYLQLVLGMSPMRAGVQLLPAVIAAMVAMLSAPRTARRFGEFSVIATGLGAGTVGFALMIGVPVGGSPTIATTAMVLVGAGLGAALTVSIDGIIASIPPERAGAGASVSETANELGTALGTAVLGSIAAAVYRSDLADTDGVPPDTVARARETLGEAAAVAEDLGGHMGEHLAATANTAFVSGMRLASIVAMVALGAVTLWAWRHRQEPSRLEAVRR